MSVKSILQNSQVFCKVQKSDTAPYENIRSFQSIIARPAGFEPATHRSSRTASLRIPTNRSPWFLRKRNGVDRARIHEGTSPAAFGFDATAGSPFAHLRRIGLHEAAVSMRSVWFERTART